MFRIFHLGYYGITKSSDTHSASNLRMHAMKETDRHNITDIKLSAAPYIQATV